MNFFLMPKGIYIRFLLIVLMPLIILQFLAAYIFVDRHWQILNRKLSTSLAQDISFVVSLYEKEKGNFLNENALIALAQKKLNLKIQFLSLEKKDTLLSKSLFSGDEELSEQLLKQIPFYDFSIDSITHSSYIEIQVYLSEETMLSVLARKSQAYGVSSYLFLLWTGIITLLLILIVILFLRNQIRPILDLAAAAKKFGKGHDVVFKPRGAREVRIAGDAFLEMKRRIEKQIEQRTAMLNGISHDLKTVITRFKLSLELLSPQEEVKFLKKDANEMARILDDYLSFIKGDAEEVPKRINIMYLLKDIQNDKLRTSETVFISNENKNLSIIAREQFIKRCLTNIIENAIQYGNKAYVSAEIEGKILFINVDDEGQGIPLEKQEEVFSPFVRLDLSRNQNRAGTGLGLSIARDIARNHGGDVTVSLSPQGLSRIVVSLPL